MTKGTKRGANVAHINEQIAERIRVRRQLLGMSQQTLGDALGIRFQQIQKYESGANRISAAFLARLGEVLQVPVTYFYGEPLEGGPVGLGHEQQQVVSLVRNFNAIGDADMRAAVAKFVKAAASAAGAREEAA